MFRKQNSVHYVVLLTALVVLSEVNVAVSAKPPELALYLHRSGSKSEAALKRVIPAARRLGYEALVLEIGGNVELDAQKGVPAQWSKKEIRALLKLAQANHLEVIPSVSLLGHPECAPRLSPYLDGSFGLKLWEPGAYEFLERFISEVCRLFGRPRYFHARMDESQQAIAENSKRLGMTSADFLADHIRRINRMVQQEGARLIIYHDMLLPAEEVSISTALGGAPLNCWRAVEEIPRDIVINFWLYQFWSAHAGAVEFFTRRGFEVWLSPWLAPEAMCQWAAERRMPVIATTWCDPASLAHYEANLRAVVLAADFRRNPHLPSRLNLPYDPLLRGVQALSAPEPKITGAFQQLPLPKSESAGKVELEVPRHLRWGGRLWEMRPVVFQEPCETLDERLKGAKLPLKVIRSDGQEHLINGMNRARGEAEIILYTPAFGPHTGTNMFGGEIVIVDGIVQDVTEDVWASGGGCAIPPGACVLSGHCAGDVPEFLSKFRMYERVRIVDSDGKDLLTEPSDDTTFQKGFHLLVKNPKPIREVWLVHATLHEMAMRRSGEKVIKPLVGEVLVHTRAGQKRSELRYRREVASWRVPRCMLDDEGKPSENVWLAWADDRGYGNVKCLWATRLSLNQPERVLSIRLRPTKAGAAAGWIVAAIAVR